MSRLPHQAIRPKKPLDGMLFASFGAYMKFRFIRKNPSSASHARPFINYSVRSVLNICARRIVRSSQKASRRREKLEFQFSKSSLPFTLAVFTNVHPFKGRTSRQARLPLLLPRNQTAARGSERKEKRIAHCSHVTYEMNFLLEFLCNF
jgi:hypothetical protein